LWGPVVFVQQASGAEREKGRKEKTRVRELGIARD
jgi:hypothetical protein